MIPDYITHYFESADGPSLNICDAPSEKVEEIMSEKCDAPIAFNRFAIGPDFLAFGQAADDLLIQQYHLKFGRLPAGRPFYGILGEFDKTLTMYHVESKLRLALSDFAEDQSTFMYPDHAHLVSYHESAAPKLFYQPPKNRDQQLFWGKLFTYEELSEAYVSSGIADMITSWRWKDGWAGSYIEAHIWDRSLRERFLQTTSPKAHHEDQKTPS